MNGEGEVEVSSAAGDNLPRPDNTEPIAPIAEEEIDFHASDIKKKEKKEYFTNIKGAARIKRNAERQARRDEKRKLREARKLTANQKIEQKTISDEAAKKDEKELKRAIGEQHAEERRAKNKALREKTAKNIKEKTKAFFRKLGYILFAKWHKFVTMGICAVALGIGAFFVINENIIIPAQIRKADEEWGEFSVDNLREYYQVVNSANRQESIEGGIDIINNKIVTLKNNDLETILKIELAVWECEAGDVDNAIKHVDSIYQSLRKEYQKEFAERAYYIIYSRANRRQDADNYRKKLSKRAKRYFTKEYELEEQYMIKLGEKEL